MELSIDTWIAIARGPLLRISLAICLLGLGYHFLVTGAQTIGMWRRAADRNISVRSIITSTLSWLMPWRQYRVRPLFGLASTIFHLGILLVPLFYAGHVHLWQESLPVPWLILGPMVSDVLAIAAIVGAAGLLASRLLVHANRGLTTPQDVLLLIVLLLLLTSGYWAAHPTSSPLGPRTMVLLHMLLGNLALVLTPLTKLVHCALYPFGQAIAELGWRFPADSGRHVGLVLQKDENII